MAKLKGVLLHGADGALYLIEGGLRACRIDPDDPARRDDPAYRAMIERVRERLADEAQLGELEAKLPPPPGDDPNLRSRILQALNVEIDRSDEGDILTIESTGTFRGF
ncbi:hypothetical protein [Benzoatithermus flavus]|uniref:TubC N-terminal docking domain-containing protein n=1 Tax=Benzoatithermus flavus TaxID=3108223 RepID=A0ABU8XQF9_9PROT